MSAKSFPWESIGLSSSTTLGELTSSRVYSADAADNESIARGLCECIATYMEINQVLVGTRNTPRKPVNNHLDKFTTTVAILDSSSSIGDFQRKMAERDALEDEAAKAEAAIAALEMQIATVKENIERNERMASLADVEGFDDAVDTRAVADASVGDDDDDKENRRPNKSTPTAKAKKRVDEWQEVVKRPTPVDRRRVRRRNRKVLEATPVFSKGQEVELANECTNALEKAKKVKDPNASVQSKASRRRARQKAAKIVLEAHSAFATLCGF